MTPSGSIPSGPLSRGLSGKHRVRPSTLHFRPRPEARSAPPRPGPPRALSLLHVVVTGSRPPPFLETAATNQKRPGGIVTSRRVPGAGTMGARARRSHVDRGRGMKKRTISLLFPVSPQFFLIFFFFAMEGRGRAPNFSLPLPKGEFPRFKAAILTPNPHQPPSHPPKTPRTAPKDPRAPSHPPAPPPAPHRLS